MSINVSLRYSAPGRVKSYGEWHCKELRLLGRHRTDILLQGVLQCDSVPEECRMSPSSFCDELNAQPHVCSIKELHFYQYGWSIHFLSQLIVIEHPPHPSVALCIRKPNSKSCLHGAHVIVGTKVSKQGKYMDCQLVVGLVEKKNVGNGERRMQHGRALPL